MKKKILYLFVFFVFLIMILFLYDCCRLQDEQDVVPSIQNTVIVEDTIKLEKTQIAITFDDGPHPVYTELLLDGLKERGVKATFFLIGKNCEEYPEIVKRIADEGHLIGNHTYSHIQLTAGNTDAFIEELVKTNKIITDITGEPVSYVRPPFGIWKEQLNDEVLMFPVSWNIDPLDWCTKNADNIAYRVTSKAEENAVILLHDCYSSSVEAALKIIDTLQNEGYEFVTVDEILFN